MIPVLLSKSSIYTKIRGIALIVIILSSNVLYSQQPQVYNQFFMNPYLYNPAYAGIEGHAAAYFAYRSQWLNLDGSPETMHASFHIPLQGGIAIGAAAFNTKQGLLTTSAFKGTGAYLLNIDRTHFLRFGLSLGAGINAVNISEFDAPLDPAFQDFLDQSTFIIGDLGVAYHFDHFNVGLSIPNLFEYNQVSQSEVSSVGFSPANEVLLKMNYRGHINDDFAIEPHILYRYSNPLPHQFEGIIIGHIKHLVWVGAGYRQDAGIIGLAGFKMQEKIAVGFAYEPGSSEESSLLGPTLEINIGYHIGIKKDHSEHTSSFIKSHRLSAEQRAEQAALERERALNDLEDRKESFDQETTEDQLGLLGGTVGVVVIDEKKGDDWKPISTDKTMTRTNAKGEEEIGFWIEKEGDTGEKEVVVSWVAASEATDMIVADDGHIERKLSDGTKEVGVVYERTNSDGSVENIVKWDPVVNEAQANHILDSSPNLSEDHHEEIAKGDPSLTQDFRTHDELSNSNDHIEVKRGTNLLELPVGSFVIGGSFSEFQHAEDYSDKLFEMGYHDTIVGYSSARGYYYVVVFQSDDLNLTKTKRDQLRKTKELKDAWVLQVTE